MDLALAQIVVLNEDLADTNRSLVDLARRVLKALALEVSEVVEQF